MGLNDLIERLKSAVDVVGPDAVVEVRNAAGDWDWLQTVRVRAKTQLSENRVELDVEE